MTEIDDEMQFGFYRASGDVDSMPIRAVDRFIPMAGAWLDHATGKTGTLVVERVPLTEGGALRLYMREGRGGEWWRVQNESINRVF